MIAALEKAWERRQGVFADGRTAGTDVFRLFNGGAEGIPGLVAERYGAVVIFQVHEGKAEFTDEELGSFADWYLGRDGIRSVYAKHFVADRSRSVAEGALQSEKPLRGEVATPQITARENGVSFQIRPYEGYSTGLFLDQRHHRQFLRERSAGKTVLNCFSYTCGFSVYAALGGGQVTSVDLSKKYLEWGKANFSLNGLEPQEHRFFAMDSFRFFKTARKRNEVYDLVVVDPPSFSRNKEGGTFSLKRDLEQLLTDAASVVAPGGEIFFSANFSEWDDRYLQSVAQRAWGARKAKALSLPPLPEDYATGPEPISRVMAKFGN